MVVVCELSGLYVVFHRGLRTHVVPIIAGAVDNNVQHQWKFDEFFPRCEAFTQRLEVVVFCLVTAEFHHVYVSRDALYVVVVVVVVGSR